MSRIPAATEKLEALRYSLDQFEGLQKQPEARFHFRSAIAELNSLVKLLLSLAKEDHSLSRQVKELRNEWENDELWKFLKALRHESEHSENRDAPKLAKHRPAQIDIAGFARSTGGGISIGKVVWNGADLGGVEASITDGKPVVKTTSPSLALLTNTSDAQVEVPNFVVDKKNNRVCLPSSVAASAEPAALIAKKMKDLVEKLSADFRL